MSDSKPLISVQDLNIELSRRVDVAENLLAVARETLGAEREEDYLVVESWIDECRKSLADQSFVSVALLGSTGAGKSTLINSLIN